ncbi:MAG: hypothetical protein ACLUIQ_07855 [Dialister invisus]
MAQLISGFLKPTEGEILLKENHCQNQDFVLSSLLPAS